MDLVRHRLFVRSLMSELASNSPGEHMPALTNPDYAAAAALDERLTLEIVALKRWKFSDQLPAECVLSILCN